MQLIFIQTEFNLEIVRPDTNQILAFTDLGKLAFLNRIKVSCWNGRLWGKDSTGDTHPLINCIAGYKNSHAASVSHLDADGRNLMESNLFIAPNYFLHTRAHNGIVRVGTRFETCPALTTHSFPSASFARNWHYTVMVRSGKVPVEAYTTNPFEINVLTKSDVTRTHWEWLRADINYCFNTPLAQPSLLTI